jgi:hypothetical protein
VQCSAVQCSAVQCRAAAGAMFCQCSAGWSGHRLPIMQYCGRAYAGLETPKLEGGGTTVPHLFWQYPQLIHNSSMTVNACLIEEDKQV